MNIKRIFATLYIFYKITAAQYPFWNVPQQPPNIVTPSPTFGYINPYCSSQEVQRFNGSPPRIIDTMTTTPKCYTSNDIALGFEGALQCDHYACCLCKRIECGNSMNGVPCQVFAAADYGATGVPSIIINGGISTQSMSGAVIECSGIESCKAVNMITRYVQRLSCDSRSSCQQANIILSDPAPNLSIHCNGPSSCVGANIIINIGEALPNGRACNPGWGSKQIIMGPIEFNDEKAGNSAIITINNNGCDKVIIPLITCMYDTSCPDTEFIFNGDVTLQVFDSGISSLICLVSSECANLVRTITNPANDFALECVSTNSCQRLQLTLDYQSSTTGYVQHVNELRFERANAANGAVIEIYNNQLNAMQYPMRIDKILCIDAYSCQGLTIIGGPNVDLFNSIIDCILPNSCRGCMMKPSSGSPIPCDYRSSGYRSFQPQQAPPTPQYNPRPISQIPPPPPVPRPVVPAQQLPQMPPQPPIPTDEPQVFVMRPHHIY